MSGGLFCVVSSNWVAPPAEYTMSAGAGSSTRRALLPLDCCLVVAEINGLVWGFSGGFSCLSVQVVSTQLFPAIHLSVEGPGVMF